MEETTLITISRGEYNALIRAGQIVLGLVKVAIGADDEVANLIDQSRDMAKFISS